MQVSIELVPRSAGYLRDQLSSIQERLPSVNTINIPDLTRMDLRSWEGCHIAKPWFDLAIPHIRAVDFCVDKRLSFLDELDAAGINEGGCHLFRHAMATHMLENGADLRFIQAILGHNDINTTTIYTHLSMNKLQQVHALTHPAEADAVDERVNNA